MTERNLVKVATFNINNINKRLDNLLAWLAKAEPDVGSLQELKAEQGAFPVNALRTLGYEAVWQGERSWNGVAILARNHVPVLTCTSLPGNPEDHQARYIEAAVQGVLITSIYLPNGNPQPGPKFNYKLAWFERQLDHFLLSPNLSDRLVTAVLTDGRVGKKTRATTRQHGSCSISRRLSSFSVRCVSRSALSVPFVS